MQKHWLKRGYKTMATIYLFIPKTNRMNYKKERDFEADKFNDGQPIYEFPANNAAYWRGVNHGFKKGADWLHSLSQIRQTKIQDAINFILSNPFDVHIVENKGREIELLLKDE